MRSRLLSNDTYTYISNSVRNITCSNHEIKQDTRLTFGMYPLPCSVTMTFLFWCIRLDDACCLQSKLVTAIIQVVCQRITSLLLHFIQTQEGCHTLKKHRSALQWNVLRATYPPKTIQVWSSSILKLQVSLSVVNFKHLSDS